MKKIYIIILIFAFIAIVALIFSSPKPQTPNIPKFAKDSFQTNQSRIEDMPGVTGVKRFSNINKNTGKNDIGANRTNSSSGSRSIVKTSIPLPYPRISINYTVRTASSIRGENAGANSTFIVLKLDIRNYGYRYFDAHPTKFKIITNDNTNLEPIAYVNTGDVLDAVLPNNSRVMGDLVFKYEKRARSVSIRDIIYLSNNYTILYKKGIPYAGEKSTTSVSRGSYGNYNVDCNYVDCP